MSIIPRDKSDPSAWHVKGTDSGSPIVCPRYQRGKTRSATGSAAGQAYLVAPMAQPQRHERRDSSFTIARTPIEALISAAEAKMAEEIQREEAQAQAELLLPPPKLPQTMGAQDIREHFGDRRVRSILIRASA